MSENTQKQEVTINDPVKGLTFTQKECGADSIYAGFKIWVKEADTIDAAAADSGATAVLNGFNSASVSAQLQRAKNRLTEGLTQGEGETDKAFMARAIAAARARGLVEINSKEDAEAYVYGSSKLSMGTISKRLDALKVELRELRAAPTPDLAVINSKLAEAKRYQAQLNAWLNEGL